MIDVSKSIQHLSLHIERMTAAIELRAIVLAGGEPEVSLLSHSNELVARAAELERDPQALAICALTRRVGLSETEKQVLLLLAAVSLVQDARALLAKAVGETGPDPSLQGIRAAIYGQMPSPMAQVELAPHGKLRRLGLIERSDNGSMDLHETRRTWALSSRVMDFFHGQDALDPTLHPLCTLASRAQVPDQIFVGQATREELSRAVTSRAGLIILCGRPFTGRRTTLLSEITRVHDRVLVVRVERLPSDEGAYNRVMQCVFREAAILDSPLLLTNLDALSGEAQRMSSLVDVAGQLSPRSLYATCAMDRPTIRGERTPVFIDLFPPSTSQRALLWHRSLGQGTSGDANVLADAYPLAAGLIVRAAESAKAHAGGGNSLRHEDVLAGIRSALDDRLSAYARRVVVRQSWNDLILTPDQLEVVVELMARVREKRRVYEDWGFADKVAKGLGVAALFSGPPGTGKTMVASLIAKELGLELYQVDLSRIMSKWIGETEKNLAGLFDAAEAGCAVLLFDEADALFGKRTDVKTSNDRHANLETNYLLQRLESFTGTCLLTTNHESNMDPAFQRRLSLHLRFSMPDAAERRKLWQSMLPTSAPRASDIDFDSLAARYVMSGGYIKNAVLRAAFLAANEDTAIAARHLEQAARVEYEGMGKVT